MGRQGVEISNDNLILGDKRKGLRLVRSGFSPMDFSPVVYYDTIAKPTGSTPSFPDETGSYTAIGGVSFVDISGESFADFIAAACYDADSAFNTFISGGHTIVMVVDADASIPAGFECLLGAFVGLGATENQHTIFQTSVTGKLRGYIKIGANQGVGDTSTQALTAGQKSVVTFRADQSGGIRWRINGVNRLMDATNDGDLSAIVLANLNITKNHFWGCRNSDGVAGSFHNGNHGALIGYSSILTDSQCMEIEDYYA